jgi:hypothetical protein
LQENPCLFFILSLSLNMEYSSLISAEKKPYFYVCTTKPDVIWESAKEKDHDGDRKNET